MSYKLTWLSGLVPFTQVQQILCDVGQLHLGRTSIWEQVQSHGERLQTYVEGEQSSMSVERTRWDSQQYEPKMTRCISMDGGMVCLREEGWKEMKVGLVSDFEMQWEKDEAGVKLKNMDYCALIGTVKTFDKALWALAVKHHVPYAGQLVVVADGAQWIWRLVADLFPVCTQIVDYYHAKQQLAKAIHAIYPEDEAQAHTCLKQMSDTLFRSEIFKIIAELNAHGHPATYFVKQQRRMQYQQFRADGFPIGSGGIESAIKQFKQRLTGPGMRWSRQGASRMITIRSAILSGSFPDLWRRAS